MTKLLYLDTFFHCSGGYDDKVAEVFRIEFKPQLAKSLLEMKKLLSNSPEGFGIAQIQFRDKEEGTFFRADYDAPAPEENLLPYSEAYLPMKNEAGEEVKVDMERLSMAIDAVGVWWHGCPYHCDFDIITETIDWSVIEEVAKEEPVQEQQELF